MAWITSTLVLRLLALVRIYSSYLLLTNPQLLLTQNTVLLLSSAMRLPLPTPSSTLSPTAIPSSPTPSTALAALALTLLSLSDLATTAMPESSYDDYWSTQSIVRTMLFFPLATWIYITKPPDAGSGAGLGFSSATGKGFGSRWADGMKNGLVFAWAFVEMISLFWVMLCLRSEREERARRIMREREERRLKEEREGVVLR